MTPDEKKKKRDLERYQAAMHACQSAVALDIQVSGEHGAAACPKHLRTGLNACLVDSSAVAMLLMEKGVFTEAEYYAALADAAEREQALLTQRMRDRTGNQKITFG